MQRQNRTLKFIAPMECRSTATLPEGEEWQYELKFDGYRLQAVKNNGEVHLYSRNGLSFDTRFPSVAEAVRALRAKEIILDGELVALDEEGQHSFALLQKRKKEPETLHFYVFDLLVYDGKEILRRPLRERRNLLEAKVSVANNPVVRHSPVLSGSPEEIVKAIHSLHLEGVVAKRLDAIYVPGEETGTWLKQRTQQSDEFLIGGYIGTATRTDEILVGRKEGSGLVYVECVKNGFVPKTRVEVFSAIGKRTVSACPFVNLPEKKGAHRMDREKMKKVRWVDPVIIAEIAFNEVTSSGHLRHSSFVRLREITDLRKKTRL